MPQTMMNFNLSDAIKKMKKDIVNNGGSCIFIIANDGELLQSGGGESEIMKHILTKTIETIEADKTGIIRTI
jgi:hypothetical protein